MQYGQLWRKMRKLVHQQFTESMVEKSHIAVQNAEAVQMLHDFCVRPDQHMLHPKRYSNSITMSLGEHSRVCFVLHIPADYGQSLAFGQLLCILRI